MRPTLWSLCSLTLLQASHGDRYHPKKLEAVTAAGEHGAMPDPAEREPHYWYKQAFRAIDERHQQPPYDEVARNVVLFLGDGMSIATLAAARTLRGQRAGRPGEETSLFFERFPVTGLTKTYCLDTQVPDLACTSTAYLCGVKSKRGMVGLTGHVARKDCPASGDPATHLESIATWALADGRSAGIVTSARVTSSSPAGAYAHAASVRWENDGDIINAGFDPAHCPDIAHQLINSSPGNRFKVILGGGRREFRPNKTMDEEGAPGRRWDGRDLVAEWRAQREAAGASHMYAWNRTDLLRAIADPPEYLLGLFRDTNLRYEAEVREAGLDKPTLVELTEAAIRVLSRNPRGFFLFVEGGRIDHAHHNNRPHLALDETLALEAAVARADALLPAASSLLVVTADHSHVMAFSGYSRRGADILGPSDDLDKYGVPYMTLSYFNGLGFRPHILNKRPDVTKDRDFRGHYWRYHADVPLKLGTHSGEDVAVFARGPQQQLFTGLYEQSQLAHLLAHAGCLGPRAARRHVCAAAPPPARAAALLFAAAAAVLLLAAALLLGTLYYIYKK